MKMIKNTAGLSAVIGATVALAGMASQEAMATTHKKAKAPSTSTIERQVRAERRAISAEDARVTNLENEVAELRTQLSAQKTADAEVAAKQQQLETQVAEEAAKENAKNNLVFFRGGFAQLAQKRSNELLTNSAALNNGQGDYNQDGWYVGAGFDYRVTDDLWGATDLMALDAELMFQYQNYGTAQNGLVSAFTNGAVSVTNQVTMFTLSASPKLKFNLMENNLRPWIIPFGLALQVVSPPSSGVTVLNPALMLGTGVEYRIWKELWLGTDFRYEFGGGDLQYSAKTADGNTVLSSTTTNGLQVGGYIGLGF
jgi:hypothetical protein